MPGLGPGAASRAKEEHRDNFALLSPLQDQVLHYHLLRSGTAIKIYFKEETTKLKFLLDNHVYSNTTI